MKLKSKKYIILLVIAVIVGYAFFHPLSILPGFEGEQAGAYGFQPTTYSSVYPLNDALPGSFAWQGFATPQSASVIHITTDALGFNHEDILEVDTQNNLIAPPLQYPQTVSYYVKNPSNPSQYMFVSGQVEVYTFGINALITSGSAGYFDFGGSTMWENIISSVWSTQSTDPLNASVNGYVFETPLYGVVTAVQWGAGQGSNNCNLCTVGASLTFYSTPNSPGQTLASLAEWTPTSGNINNTLGSVYAPDQRMQRVVYFPLSFTSWKGCTLISLGCTVPNAHITITLYTLRLGEYILTNPSTTSLGSNGQSNCNGLGCVSLSLANLWKALTSPLGLLGLSLFGLAAIAVVVVLGYVLIFRRRP